MPNTYTLIASSTATGGSVANIEFTSIPATYTDLKVVFSARGTVSGNNVDTKLTFNSNTSNYTLRNVYGDGSTAASFSDSTTNYTGGEIPGTSITASTFGSVEIYIPNYTSSNNKSFSTDVVVENNATTAFPWLHAGLWSNAAAITSVTLTPASGSFAQYSTARLYGIKNS